MLLALRECYLACNPLEASVAVAHLDVLLVGNLLDNFCSNDGLHDEVSRLHLAHRLTVLDDVIQEQQTCLVSVDENPLTLVVLARHTYTVGIGVAGHHDVSIHSLGITQRKGKRLTVLGVRTDNCREIATLDHLLFYTMHIFKTPLLDATRNHSHTCTVQGSIDNLEVFLTLDDLRINRNALNQVEINLIDIFANDLDKVFVTLELHILNTHLVDFVDDACVMRCKHLCTIFPISLVSVVLLGIVAGSDIHTTLASQMTDCKRTLRSRTHVIKEINLDSVGREDVCHSLCKKTAVVTAVVAYHHRNLLAVGKVLFQIIGKSLCSHTYGIDVHTVATGTHNATQATSTKLKIFVETLNEFRLVLTFEHSFYRLVGLFVKNR